MNNVTTNVTQKSEILFELAAILGHQNDFEGILRLVSTKTCVLVDAEAASIMMINPRTQDTIKTIVKKAHKPIKSATSLCKPTLLAGFQKRKKLS